MCATLQRSSKDSASLHSTRTGARTAMSLTKESLERHSNGRSAFRPPPKRLLVRLITFSPFSRTLTPRSRFGRSRVRRSFSRLYPHEVGRLHSPPVRGSERPATSSPQPSFPSMIFRSQPPKMDRPALPSCRQRGRGRGMSVRRSTALCLWATLCGTLPPLKHLGFPLLVARPVSAQQNFEHAAQPWSLTITQTSRLWSPHLTWPACHSLPLPDERRRCQRIY